MILFVFSITIMLCFEISIFLKIKITLKKLIELYKNVYTEINNEEIFINLSKKILYNSFKLFSSLLMSLVPMILFLLFLKINNNNIYNFILSYYNIVISIIIFFMYYYMRKKFVKRKL